MTIAPRDAVVTIICAAALVCSGGAAVAGSTVVHVDGPVVIGGQLFQGGTIEIKPFSHEGLLAIRLDGRQVALAFREPGTGSGAQLVVLRRDKYGRHYLVGLQCTPSDRRAIQVAAVTPGLETVATIGAAPSDGAVSAAR